MTKVNKIDFQRNGITGNGFFVIEFKMEGKELIGTFEVEEGANGKEKIKEETMRVVNPKDLTDKYRGDNIAHDLQYQFEKLREKKWESEKKINNGKLAVA